MKHFPAYVMATTLLIGCIVSATAPVTWAATAAVKCQSGKLKEVGKYGLCRFKALAKGVQKGVAPYMSALPPYRRGF